MQITVGIITFNESKNIERCLRSLKGQTGLTEIILADNASSDDTKEKAKDLAQKMDLNLKVLARDTNNLAEARQDVLNVAQNTYVAFIDADCEAPSHWLTLLWERLIDLQRRDPHFCAVGGPSEPPLIRSFYRLLQLMTHTPLGHLYSRQFFFSASDESVDHLPTCNVLYERNKILAAGGFRSQFAHVCEDLDLSLRLKSQNFRLGFCPQAMMHHYYTPTYWGWIKKIFRYGEGQIHLQKYHPQHLMGLKSLPLFFLVVWIASFLMGVGAPLALVYILTVFVCCLVSCISLKQNLFYSLPAAGLLVSTHFAYSLGEARGVLGALFLFNKSSISRRPFECP